MSAEAALDEFLAKYTPAIEAQGRAALARMRARLPGAHLLVYDNYNALAVAFSANEKLSGVVFSIALYPRWVSLFFSWGAVLPDPKGLLKGSGKSIRHIVLKDASLIASPDVEALIAEALALATTPIDPDQPGRLIVKSVSAKQRPRRPDELTI